MSAASCSKVNAHTPTKTDSLNTRLFLNDSIICGYFCSNNLMEDTSSNLINKLRSPCLPIKTLNTIIFNAEIFEAIFQ